MKVKDILKLLSILIILTCIISVLIIIFYFENIMEFLYYSRENEYLNVMLIVLLSSIILSIITLRNIHLDKHIFFQILYSMIIFGLNLGILIYFTIIIPNFWIEIIIGLTELKLIYIVSICCSAIIALLSFFQIKSNKKMKISIEDLKKDLKNDIKLFYLRLGQLLAYFPIIAGILFSMTVMPALAYLSWYIFYLSPGVKIMSGYIVNIEYFPDFPIYPLLWTELIIFICGFALFLYGLIHLAKAKKGNIDIVQTGPYKYIRHPQNLGIIIFSFPFCLYVPFFSDSGIKVGDIFSWMLFVLLIIIYSDIEEIFMLKKYPDKYGLYKVNTGFFTPNIIKTNREKSNLEIKNYIFRWIFLIGGYILLISILAFIFSKFPLLYLREILD